MKKKYIYLITCMFEHTELGSEILCAFSNGKIAKKYAKDLNKSHRDFHVIKNVLFIKHGIKDGSIDKFYEISSPVEKKIIKNIKKSLSPKDIKLIMSNYISYIYCEKIELKD